MKFSLNRKPAENSRLYHNRGAHRLPAMLLAASLALLAGSIAHSGQHPPLPDKYERSPYSLMSLTVGAPNKGYQIRAKRLRESPQLKIKSGSHGRVYGHPALVLMLQRSAKDIAKAAPNSVMLVGDLSHKKGGPISKHRSHQSGRDADIGFYVRNDKGAQIKLNRFVKIDGEGKVIGMPGAYFDEERNWQLVRSWLRDKRAGIAHVFVASHVRNRLLRYARANKARARHFEAAAKLLKQPSNSSIHDDHYHLRIRCPDRQKDICVEEALSD